MALGRSENLVGAGAASIPAGTRWNVWVGRVLSALPVLAMVASAAMKLARPPQVVEAFTGRYGYPANTLAAIAAVELACALLYVIPRTALLGAALVTAYLGGAVATHVRAGEPFVLPVLLGVLVWGGLYLREKRLHPLLPLRRAVGP